MNETVQLGSRRAAFRSRAFLTTVAAILVCLLYTAGISQEPVVEDEAPPPTKKLSKEEKERLAGETNVKGRTALSLELMSKRVNNAELLNSSKRFDEMFKELADFNALMDDALRFLVSQDKDKGKVLYNFKRLDIGLRAFLPRLEVVRRDVPAQYEPYVRRLIKYIDKARERPWNLCLAPPSCRNILTINSNSPE